MSLSKELLDILVCPKCKGQLDYHEVDERLICAVCQLAFPVENDIPIMIIDQAHTLDEADRG